MGWQEAEAEKRRRVAADKRAQKESEERHKSLSKTPMRALWKDVELANQLLPPELRMGFKSKHIMGDAPIIFQDYNAREITIYEVTAPKIRELRIYYDDIEGIYKICGVEQGFKRTPGLPFFPKEDLDSVLKAAVLSQSLEDLYNEMRDQPDRMRRKEMARAPSFLERLFGI